MARGSDNQVSISNWATLWVYKQEQEDTKDSFCHRLERESFPRAREVVKTLTTKTHNKSHLSRCSASPKRKMIHIEFCFRNLVRTYQPAPCAFIRPENVLRSENQVHALCA